MTKIIANFPNSAGHLPFWVGDEQGSFAKRGIEIGFVRARGSAAQYTELMEGRIHVFTTLMENVIAYAWGEGEKSFDPPTDAFGFMGGSLGHQSLMARPGIASIADLKGRTLAASGLRTGNALILYGMLAKAGLQLDRDYRVVAVGGGPVTVESLTKAGADASLMNSPNDADAKAQGFTCLADSTDVFGGYQASVYMARRSWAEAHRDDLIALIAALVESYRFIVANPAAATEILRARLSTLSEDEAARVYRDLVSGRGRFNPDGRIDERDVRVVLDLRNQFSKAPHPEAKPADFYDLSYLDAALRSLTT